MRATRYLYAMLLCSAAIGCRPRPSADKGSPAASSRLSADEAVALALARQHALKVKTCVAVLQKYSSRSVLDPTKPHNTVRVSADGREVTFTHNGLVYDGDMVKIVVSMNADGIVELLKGRALCVNALTARLGLTQGAVSQHLRVLRDAGIVVREKRGYYVHYMIDDAKLREVREVVCAFLSGGGGSTGKPKGEKRCARGRSAVRSRKK
jgi:DNA-binding transcriptional ArsR family regulator